MIYLVDEDINQNKAFVMEMHLRDMEVQQVCNADKAMEEIVELREDDFLLIDVMLSADPEEDRSQFNREDTKDFKITGIRLLEKLFKKFPSFPKSHGILFSQASGPDVVFEIKRFVHSQGCSWMYKNEFDDPLQFGDALEKIIHGG